MSFEQPYQESEQSERSRMVKQLVRLSDFILDDSDSKIEKYQRSSSWLSHEGKIFGLTLFIEDDNDNTYSLRVFEKNQSFNYLYYSQIDVVEATDDAGRIIDLKETPVNGCEDLLNYLRSHESYKKTLMLAGFQDHETEKTFCDIIARYLLDSGEVDYEIGRLLDLPDGEEKLFFQSHVIGVIKERFGHLNDQQILEALKEILRHYWAS